VNRRETAVRLRHLPTGIVVTCQDERSQHRNKRIALARLREQLEERNQPIVERVPTTVPRSVRRRILESKRRRAHKKSSRKRPEIDD
jgi:protein subunit release factor A